MITFAATSVPSASRAVACPSAWSIARTWVRCLSRAPFSSARFSSAASNSSRTTIASSGSPCERVNSCPPRSVMVARRISSRAGTSIRPPAAARDAPIRPPPQVLYRGCSARSSTIVRAPAAAEALAAASPAGPAPTTATSHTSRSCTPSSLGDRHGPAPDASCAPAAPRGEAPAAEDLRKNPQKSCWHPASCLLIQVQDRGTAGMTGLALKGGRRPRAPAGVLRRGTGPGRRFKGAPPGTRPSRRQGAVPGSRSRRRPRPGEAQY